MRFHRIITWIAGAALASSVVSMAQGLTAAAAPAQDTTADKPTTLETGSKRAAAYYNYTMGHIYEQQYENSSRAEDASEAIDFYKKAYALDPRSPVIGERLAEMYWKAQRVQDAITEAEEIIRRDPSDVPTRRLLGRIYLRSLGDLTAGGGQSDIAAKAIEQYQEIYRLDPSDTESALWLARLYRLRNEHQKAGEVLRAILKEDPENEAAIEQLTQLLLDQGQSAEALSLLEGITKRSTSPALFDLLGDAYTQTKRLPEAERTYRKAAELDPSEPSHQRGLGQTLMAEGKYQEALAVYQKLAELVPDDADAYLRMAQIYRQLHQLDNAEQNLLKARQYAPGSVEVMDNEALLYEAQGRYEDAVRVLSDAVAGVKNDAAGLPGRRRSLSVLYQQLGQLYKESENYSAAVNTYGELSHLGEEEDRRSRVLIMDAYRAAKNLPKALEVGREALAKYPQDPLIRSNQALLLGENAQTDEAVTMLRAQLTKGPADRDIHLNIAEVYEQGRRYKEAEQSARAAELLPGSPHDKETVWLLLGSIYEKQKMYDRAEEEFKKALAVNPKDAPVLNYYGYMLGDLGQRLDEAASMVQRALEQDPFNGAYLDSMGWIYYRQNRLAEAETLLRQAIQRDGHDPTIHAHLGDVYAKLGRTEQAAAEWEKSLAEWHRALPADIENDKIVEVQEKLGRVKERIARKSDKSKSQ